MRKYLLMILFLSTGFGQDVLTLKKGASYEGEFLGVKSGKVHFQPTNVYSFKPRRLKEIRGLTQNGELLIQDGKWTVHLPQSELKISKQWTVHLLQSELKKGEKYQKLSTKEKAIYDAKSKNLRIWALYVPTSIITFGGCVLLYENLKGGEFWESEIFLGGSSAASLTISYFVLNNKEKNSFPKSILTNSEKEIYKQVYSKKLRQRKFKNVVGSTILTGAVMSLIYMNIMSDFHLDLDFGGMDVVQD